jgi:iron complex outermembrane recepter protein
MSDHPCWRPKNLFHALSAACALMFASLSLGAAQPPVNDTKKVFNIPAGEAEAALKLFSEQSGRGVIFSAADVTRVKTNEVRGELLALTALEQLVANTPLKVTQDAITGAFSLSQSVARSDSGEGTIEGRVQNTDTGEYTERARISVVGTNYVTFTDADGYYRLTKVPAGEVSLETFYTGTLPKVTKLRVQPNSVSKQDIGISAKEATGSEAPLVLSTFVVTRSREISGAARAINEQRFAPDQRTVLSTDEFGDIAEANIGEFMKFMPGVNIDHAGGNARTISINGVPGDYVPVTVGGFTLASATGDGAGSTNRNVALDTISINNLSRVEVTFSPTPESPGAALAGTVNFVPRSSFERANPVFNFSTNLAMRSDATSLGRTAAPRGFDRKIHPGGDFSYIVPVNKRFGFTLAGGYSKVYSGEPLIQNTWRGAQLATNGTDFPHTTFDKPYLTSFTVRNSQKQSVRSSFSATVDYKLTDVDRISLGFQASTFDVQTDNNVLTFNITRLTPADFSLTAARGVGNLTLAGSGATRTNLTYTPSFIWRHDGRLWKTELGLAHSHSENRSRNDGDVGNYFGGTNATRTGLNVAFEDVGYYGPNKVTVTDTLGAAVDPYSVNSYLVTTASRTMRATDDTQRTAYVKLRRDFYGAVPLSIRTGLDFRQGIRDIRFDTPAYTYVGPDGIAATTALAGSDNTASPFIDEGFSSIVGPYQISRFDAVSGNKLYERFVASPQQFTNNPNTDYRAIIASSKRAEELVSATYLRADLDFFNQRLKVIGGLRAEQTNIDAAGPLTDPSRNILRNADGTPQLNSLGRTQPIATDPLEVSKLTFIERGAISKKEYLTLFPSINASYELRDNLIFRASYATSIGRPDYNQYAGGLTLPDPENPQPTDRITVSNVAIKPWSAKSVTARIEYYLPQVGQVSLGAFRRDLTDFFGNTTFSATPEFLALYDLDPDVYGQYPVVTQFNLDTAVRMEGLNFSYKQALTFLPPWARGLQVFANGAVQRMTGSGTVNFPAFIPRTASWGLSLNRKNYVLRANWNYRSEQRRNAVANGVGVDPDTYTWFAPRLYMDLNAEYRFYQGLSLYTSVRNVLNAPDDTKIYAASTPEIARFRSRNQFGSLWIIGIKGIF